MSWTGPVEHRCTPREAALRLLDAAFGAELPSAAGSRSRLQMESGAVRTFPLAPFQEAGLLRLRRLLGLYGGAVLADDVGLGKTYVGLALIEEQLRAGAGVVVAAPAALRRHWEGRLRAFRGSGASPVFVSHARLSRGAAPVGQGTKRLLVVDEAHRFRNPQSRRYAALARMAREATETHVLLITASPINNSTADLYHLLRLFLADDGLRDAGVPSLRAAFESGQDGTAAPSAGPALTAVVRAVVVRRTRAVAEDRFRTVIGPEGARFPRRSPVRAVEYDRPGLTEAVAAIQSLELLPFEGNASALVRMNLLKRLDSGSTAFQRSAERLRGGLESCREAALAGRLLRPGRASGDSDGDPLQLLMPALLADPAPPDIDLDGLAESLRRDLQRLEDLGPTVAMDRKLGALRGHLAGLAPERVLVFTEYRDTAEEIWRGLARTTRVGRVDGSGAWLGRTPAGRRAVIERFAPAANGRSFPDRERVDVLVATDVLAEGLNLQDARHVISYDLPWNPVRLLQRIGRIDRLGSPHDEVVPHLFVPRQGLDAVLGLTRAIALDYAADGVRCNCVCPGITDTPMLRHHLDSEPDPEQALANRLRRVPLGVALTPRDVARAILYFAGEDSAGITGTFLVVDAGYTAAAEWEIPGRTRFMDET